MGQGFFQIGFTLLILIIISPRLGKYIARVFLGEKTLLHNIINPLEKKIIYKLVGVKEEENMKGLQYARAAIITNLLMGTAVYFLIAYQGDLPFNPNQFGAPNWDLTLHTTISFLTSTGQQHYAGEKTLSYFSQIAGVGFLMFTSCGTSLAVGIAFIRGITGRPLGNFYIDIIRAITRIFLPISIVGAIALLISGVPQTLAGPVEVRTLEGIRQYIARGPVASFEIIKVLGNSGGGFFGVNSAHPFENPNGASNLIEIIAMLAIPAALIHTYGIFSNNRKQSWLLFWMVFAIFTILVGITAVGELQGNPIINAQLRLNQPNLEGKELRFGWAQTALWTVTTAATMSGAVNGMHDSLMPTSIFVNLSSMFVQVIWGKQGTGIVYLVIFEILTVFVAGLLVGKNTQFLGKQICRKEVLLCSLILLIHPFIILLPTAITLAFPQTLWGVDNIRFHNISQVIYEFTSAATNNGSGLESLKDNTLWWNLSTAASILISRYVPTIAMLLLADTMLLKPIIPERSNKLKLNNSVLTSISITLIFILGFLSFFPFLALGPIAENFKIAAGLK